MNAEEALDHLTELKELLDKFYEKGVRDCNSLNSTLSKLRRFSAEKTNSKKNLQLSISKLIFEISGTHKHTLPVGADTGVLVVSINMEFDQGVYNLDKIRELNINFEINSYTPAGEPLKSAWHLDYHKLSGKEEFAHPQFHFQFGGQKIRNSLTQPNQTFNTGELVLMETPRLMHPPLDPVLAINFIFENFLSKDAQKELRKSRVYSSIHRKSAELFWKPYFEKIADYFSPPYIDCNYAQGYHPGLHLYR